MRKEILKLFYIPIIGFIILTVIYFGFLYKTFTLQIQNNINILSKKILDIKKEKIKNEVETFKYIFHLIENIIYSSVKEEMRYMINNINENKLVITDRIIFGEIPSGKKFKYTIYKNNILLNYKGKNYLVVLTNKGKKVYIAGISKYLIDNLVLDTMKKYLNFYNKDKISYIALGKINTFNPKKDGIFGYIYYMPSKLKYLEGKQLSINEPDIKGNYFRKEYFKCLKNNKSCFVKYYFQNPKNSNIEEKISYITFITDYNLSVLKGIYKSQIEAFINQKAKFYINRYKSIFILGIVFYILTFFVFGLVIYFILRKVKQKVLNRYEIMRKELEKKYFFDSLTKLPNRFSLVKDISSPSKKINCIAIFDIKDFGMLNELYGYEIGNEILKHFGKILKRHFDYVYKFGNDEFAVLCKEYGIFGKILIFRDVYFRKIKIEFNVGISRIEPLIETAEIALYKAKSLNKFVYNFEQSLKEELENKYNKIQMLRTILKNKNIIPYYQGIVDKEGKIIKYEALMRLKDEEGNILSPFMFMNEIKQAKLYDKFSFMMIKKVISNVKKCKCNVSVNLSFEDIENERIKKYLLELNKDILKYITFEILESESIASYNKVNGFISFVKDKGAKIAIDDFGSGYSNFIQILRLNSDFIKIDGSLVKKIKDDKYADIVKFIIEFCKKFNIKTVAEFVEDEESFEILKNLGCDYFQGYYFCKPLPFDKISSKKGHNEN